MTDLIALDISNTSGRIMNIHFDGEKISDSEVYRFPNIPVTVAGTLYWDVLSLWREMQGGLENALIDSAAGIGIDSFGVDFGLLDANGQLIGNPVHMRDSRTDGMMEWVFERVPRETLFQRTAIGFYIINSLYQLAGVINESPWQFEVARTFLTMPNLFNYWLTGEKVSEFTHTTTTQCYNPFTKNWDHETLNALGIPTGMFPEVVQPGTRIGAYQAVPVFAVASHDTGSAVVAVPSETPNYAYISSGTWNLVGLEVQQPINSRAAMEANITNEGGAFGTYRPLKMVMGLWIIQQCREVWNAAGIEVDYAVLLKQAEEAAPLRSLFDPDDPVFFPPGDMPERVRGFCERTGQPVPENTGEIARCIFESLALKYRYVFAQLEAVSGQSIDVIHIVGGGSQNAMLCQMTADAAGRPVIAGPVEATSLGNGLVQLIALDELSDIAEARALIRSSYPLARYEPKDSGDWDGAYERFKKLITVG